jgi:hypothetical protein
MYVWNYTIQYGAFVTFTLKVEYIFIIIQKVENPQVHYNMPFFEKKFKSNNVFALIKSKNIFILFIELKFLKVQ